MSEQGPGEQDLSEKLRSIEEAAAEVLRRRHHEAIRRSRRQRAEAMLMLTMGLLAGTILVSMMGLPPFDRLRINSAGTNVIHDEELRRLSGRLDALQRSAAAAAVRLPASPAGGLDQLTAGLGTLEQRVGLIEKSIASDPERALSIPLLRRDVDALSARLTEMQARIDTDVRQLTSTVQAIFWAMLSAMGVLIVTGIGLLAKSSWKGEGKAATESKA